MVSAEIGPGEPRRLHPGTVLLNVLRRAPGFVFGIPVFLAFARGIDLWLAGLIAMGLGAAAALFQYLEWRRFTYQLTEDAVVIESGVLSRNRRTIPFDRVQDVDIERKLLARLFGLARVSLETGGAGEDEGALDSVSMAEAERLRGVIRRRATDAHRQVAATDDAAPVASDDAPVLFRMSVGRVLYSGLFRFSLIWLAVIGGLLQYLEDLLPFDLWDEARWQEMSVRVDTASHAAEATWLAGAAATLLLAVLLLGIVAGVIRTLSRDYGFTLTDEGGRYRRVRGLLTRTEAVVALRRVQLAVIENGFVMRLLGWAGMKLQTLGSGEKGEGGRQDVAPFARPDELDRVLAPLSLARADPDLLTRVSKRHIWRMLATRIGWLIPPIVGLTIGRIASGPGEAALLLLALTILFALLAVPVAIVALLQRGHHRYGLIGRALHVQRGVLGQKRWIVPGRNVQAVTIRRGWLQRRLGTASVYPDTAGASLLSTPAIEDVRPEQAWALVEALKPCRRQPG